MNYVFDLDGTLCFNGISIDPSIIKRLQKLETQGNKIIFASARPIRDLLPLVPEFKNNLLIGGNGSIISRSRKIQVIKEIPEDTFENIKSIIDTYELDYIIDDDFDYTAQVDKTNKIFKQLDPDSLASNIDIKEITKPIKIILLDIDQENLTAVQSRLAQIEEDINLIIHSDEGNIDITAANINKYETLKKLISNEKYVAFGNDHNDIELLNNASSAYFVGDSDKAKDLSLSNVHILDKDSTAITETLENFIK